MTVAPSDHIVDVYATRVATGQIPAGKYHRLACDRHLRDRARENTPGFPYRFDAAKADRFYRFAARLKHYKGEWAGEFIILTDCQKFRFGCTFGWVRTENGLRRFRKSYNEIPRKNGKSLESAIAADYTTFFDGEPGADGYCAATKRDQSKIVFNDAKKLVESSGLKTRITVQVANLHRADTTSKLEPLSADHDSMDGLNPHFVSIDEFHAFKDRGLIDVLETAMGARRQPLMFEITTAGDDLVSPCGDEHEYACKILDAVIDDETFFAFIAHADVEDDWLEESTWRKANPHYGISVNPEDMRALAMKAKNMPAAAAAFKQKRLNLWVNSSQPWLSLEGWRAGQSNIDPQQFAAELEHESCWVGVDLASAIDLCALSAIFPPTDTRPRWRILRWIWTPKDTMVERAHRDRAPYSVWAEQGHLIAIDGVRLNHTVIRDVLVALRDKYRVEQIGFDPWHADQVVDDLIDEDGFDKEQVILVPQTYAGMSKACLDYEGAVLEGKMDANSCPVQTWAASNVVVQRDGKDNIYPVKKKSRGRIDPQMANIIGFKLATLGEKTRKRPRRMRAKIWTPSGFKEIGDDAQPTV